MVHFQPCRGQREPRLPCGFVSPRHAVRPSQKGGSTCGTTEADKA
jgi:hypothetical protein